MATARITDKLVRGLETPSKGYRVTYDDGQHKGGVAGFGIRITAGGARSFVFRYRNAERIERLFTIGSYGPHQWSVERARREAGALRRRVDRGEDPMGEKAEARASATVNDLCDRYIEDHLPRKRERSQEDDKLRIKRAIRPMIGNRKVAAVAHADVDKLHRDMKTTPYEANRVLSLLSKMFNLAVKWGLRADNPCRGVERFPEHRRNRYLAPAELQRLTEALAAYPEVRANRERKRLGPKVQPETLSAARRMGKAVADVVRLCLLTGCRRGEALAATWAQFDLESGIWTKPAATTKTNTEHRVPLSDAAVLLLRGMSAEAKSDEADTSEPVHVFPDETGESHLTEIKRGWQDLRRAAAIPDVRLHDLRHTYASILVSAGASLPMIGALLGHTQPSTTARYAHLFADPLRAMTNEVGHVVSGAASADVVQHPKSETGA